MYSPTFSIGIIGAGHIVETNHVPVLKAMGQEIIWILDYDKTKAQNLASLLKCSSYSSIEELKNAPSPDVILIACPYGARHDYYKLFSTHFLQSSILIEKPIALTLEEQASIEQLRDNYKIGAFYSRRVTSMVDEVKKIVKDGIFGQLRQCYIGYGGIGMVTLGRYVSNVAMAGGGTLFDNAIHDIDALNYILEARDVSVTQATMLFDEGIEIHTEANYTIEADTNNIPCNLVVTHLKEVDTGIKLYFDNCIINFSTFGGDITLNSINNGDSLTISPHSTAYKNREHEHPYLKFWEAYLNGLTAQKVNFTNLCTTRLATNIIENIYKKGGRNL